MKRSVWITASIGLVALVAIFAGRDRPREPVTPVPVAASMTDRAPALEPREIALRSFASVVVVTTEDAKQRPIAVGSGFVVRPGVVATNFHVIRNARIGHVRLVGDADSWQIRGVVAVDRRFDLALLSVPDLEAPPLAIGDSDVVGIGDRIYVIGNPQSLEGTFSEGIVSGKRLMEDVRMLQFTAPISTGSSGGPLLDREARVVGIVSSSMRGGQNLNFAILSSHLQSLLEHDGELEELALAAQPERQQASPSSRRSSGRGSYWFSRITRLLRID